MVGITGGGGSGGYNYVQDSEPAAPEEGEEWYDTGANTAFVYDGAAWVELTVVDHEQLGGVGAADHHSEMVKFPVYASTGDVPAIAEGEVVYISGDGSLYVEDGT